MHRALCKRAHLPVMQLPLIDVAARFAHLEPAQFLDSSRYRRHPPGGKATLALKECQQVGVELVFVRFGEAVGCARVDLQRRVLDQLR